VHVKDRALRGHLHLAPPGTTKLVDELRALLAANVVRGISVGFRPVESKPRGNGGGTHFLRQTLIEASLVSVPANPAALLTAKALGISRETIAKVFKPSDSSSTAQRIREFRRSIQRFKDRIARETNPKIHASMTRALKALERAEREMVASLSDVDRRQDSRERTQEALDRIVDQQIAEYESSWEGQLQRQHDEIIANFTDQALKHRDPPKTPHDSVNAPHGTWRGVPLPPPTWRGKRVY
jgi:hypothetical protein